MTKGLSFRMFSRAVYIFSVIVMCYASFFFYPRWKQANAEATIAWDVSGYYWYLPSLFIYKDIRHQSFKDSVLQKYGPTNQDFQQAMKVDNGNYVLKYSSGMAVMYLPFFAVAHTVAGPLGYPRDGFSAPYQLAIQLGGFLISLLGLWYLRKLLLLFYEDKVVGTVLFLIALGSNYLNYSSFDCGMSHTWLFTLYVFLILNTVHFYRTFQLKYAIRIGLLVGLAALSRPTDAISCMIPLLWGMDSITPKAIRARFALIGQHFKPLLVAALCAMAVVGIQIMYWKYASGNWLVYSYDKQGFSWKHPHLVLYSFNYRTGWLTYAPMMLLAVIGLVPFILSGKNRVAIIVFALINYYIVSAWDIWWYGGRAMVQSYVVLSFPLAAFVQAVLQRRALMWVVMPFVLVFFYFNIWITWHYHKDGLYDSDCMSNRYFWRVVGRWSAPEPTLALLDNKYLYEAIPTDTTLIYSNDFEQDTAASQQTPAISGSHSLVVNKIHPESPKYTFALGGSQKKWLRVEATYRCPNKEWDIWKMPKIIGRFIDKSKKPEEETVRYCELRVERFLHDGLTRRISMDMQPPKEHFDSVVINFTNMDSDKELLIDDLKVWSFNK